jgi:hypothetical protein
MWTNPPKLGKASQSQIRAFAAEADSLGIDNEFSREFPGGYRGIAMHLVPDRVWLTFKLLVPGSELGTSYDGLVWMRDHWAWFPKPWRVLGPLTN